MRNNPPKQMALAGFDDLDVPEDRYPTAFLSRPRKLPKLDLLVVEALKGIEHLEVTLEPLTVLTGPNDSGKSTILQAILLGFECFRRCLDASDWQLSGSGRAVSDLDFLPVNEPKDLWFRRIWKPSRDREQYVRVGLTFDNGVRFTARIRFLYGMLNVGLEDFHPTPTPELLKELASASPILVPPTSGPQAHEPVVALAQLHRLLGIGQPSRVVRNILWQLQTDTDPSSWHFVCGVVKRYFGIDLEEIDFDERRDLEFRAPYVAQDFSLDIVSAGSGVNQILQLAAMVAWRRPGIVLLDEPDSHLHATLQLRLLDFLTELSTTYGLQIIAATHSRDLISQAPLHAIVPVDLTRTELAPLGRIEHLLLEFERQGPVSNVDLALLYQTKKCLFVEGPTDSRLLPKLAERLGFSGFRGREQIVPFEFSGVDNTRLIPQVIALFERMVGSKLSWAVVRDRDANLPNVIAQYRKQAADLGIMHLHIWETYSLENLLLDADLIEAALRSQGSTVELERSQIVALLEEAVREVEPTIGGLFVPRAQLAYRDFQIAERPFEQAASDAVSFLSGLTTIEQKLQHYPGKRVFGQFVGRLQEHYGVNLRLDDLVSEVTPANTPADIRRFVEMLSSM